MYSETVYYSSSLKEKGLLQILGRATYQLFVFCIAFPLATFVVLGKGGQLMLRVLARLSGTFLVGSILIALVLALLLILAVQVAAASMA